MSGFSDLKTLAEQAAARFGKPMPKPAPRVVTKEKDDKTKAEKGKTFRDAIWGRDKGCCRATGDPLLRSGTTDAKKLGEVDHAYPRSLAPERIYDVANGLLLSKYLNRLRKAVCPKAPEHRLFDYAGPEDRGKPQTFIWRDDTGKVTKTRIG